jgi:hypothetical protein
MSLLYKNSISFLVNKLADPSSFDFTTFYELVLHSNVMKATGTWNKMVHATFRKVVAFDLLFMGLGIAIGAGVGAYVVTAGLVQ